MDGEAKGPFADRAGICITVELSYLEWTDLLALLDAAAVSARDVHAIRRYIALSDKLAAAAESR